MGVEKLLIWNNVLRIITIESRCYVATLPPPSPPLHLKCLYSVSHIESGFSRNGIQRLIYGNTFIPQPFSILKIQPQPSQNPKTINFQTYNLVRLNYT